MASTDQLPELLARLDIKQFDSRDCVAAIKGERVPGALGLLLLRFCVVRGIRYNDGFARELRGVLPIFTRALNARDIMSNRIPLITLDEEIPYCIWHPQLASEATYRQLAKQYPSMSYQELDILPDVHIAEEARECGNSAIFDHIMAQPIRYDVMNDYNRTVDTANPAPAHMNGDTAVNVSLGFKQRFSRAEVPEIIDGEEMPTLDDWPGYTEKLFNITEDMGIDIANNDPLMSQRHNDTVHSELLIKLLTEPLPTELPTVDKNLLIQMGAYYGNLDRYVRLRRPDMVSGELECCVRGIYHNTMFAVWWSKQPLPSGRAGHKLRQAICARFIMNNVLSEVTADESDMPYLIWYPTIAAESTHRKLAQLSPGMLPQILRACIVANHVDLFDELIVDIIPDEAVVKESQSSVNPHFQKVLAAKIEAVGQTAIPSFEGWKLKTSNQLDRSENDILKTISSGGPSTAWETLCYNGMSCAASDVELMSCLPKEWKLPADASDELKPLDYVDWPQQHTESQALSHEQDT